MKTNYLFFGIVCFFFSTQIKAQATLTNTDIILGTFSYTDVSFNQGVYNPGNGGANITWDLSNVQGTTGGGTYFYGNCPGISECSSYPTANRYVTPLNPDGSETDDKNMFRVTSTQFEALGLRNATTNNTIAYSDTPIILKFPTTYLQSFTDTSTQSANGVTTTTNDIITVDGYGIIKTPVDTYTNVLRVKKASTIAISLNGAPVSTTQQTTYMWYKNNREQIASFSVINLISPLAQPGPSAFTYTNRNDLSIEESHAAKPLLMYPNPVRDGKLWIDLPSDVRIKSINVYDMTGRRLFVASQSQIIQIGEQHVINLQDYANGNYIVKVETDKNTVSQILQLHQE